MIIKEEGPKKNFKCKSKCKRSQKQKIVVDCKLIPVGPFYPCEGQFISEVNSTTKCLDQY